MIKNSKPIHKSLFVFLLALSIFMAGCASSTLFKKDSISKVKSAAVVVYTVPSIIEYKEDPKEKKQSGLSLTKLAVEVAKATLGKADGDKAATFSYEIFTSSLNGQGLPFKVMTKAEVESNQAFKALYVPPKEPEKEGGMASLAKGLFAAPAKGNEGKAPAGLNQYGLTSDWNSENALMGTADEKEYIKKAIEALNVDAVILVQDPGYSFSCKACSGTAGAMNGAASTGSTFVVTMIDKNGTPIMTMKEWFTTTGGTATMVMGVVNPLDHERLFKAHGEKTAKVFADFFNKKLQEKDKK